MRNCRAVWTVMLAGAFALWTQGGAAGEALEYAVKATFLYKFAPFVTWPAHGDGNFALCVAGSDPVAELVPKAAAGQRVDGRPIVVRQMDGAGGIAGCAILYIAGPPETRTAMLAAARGKPVLTVTDGGLAPDAHGIIAFEIVDHHVRFDIDEAMAAAAGLAISSKLLSLAHTVTPQT